MNIRQEILGERIATKLKEAMEDTENRLDAELERLEALDEDDLERIREKRRKELAQKRANAMAWRQLGHGAIVISGGETDFFAHCKRSPKIFCHFSHPTINVQRSEYLTKHMQQLAAKHLDILFLDVNVEQHPFLTDRLNVSVIPTVIFICEMKMSHISVGFSELNDSDTWTEADLEKLLQKNQMLVEYSPKWQLTRKEIVYPDDE